MVLSLVEVEVVPLNRIGRRTQAQSMDETGRAVPRHFSDGKPNGTLWRLRWHSRRIDRPECRPKISLSQCQIEHSVAAEAEATQIRPLRISSVGLLNLFDDLPDLTRMAVPDIARPRELGSHDDESVSDTGRVSGAQGAVPSDCAADLVGGSLIVPVKKTKDWMPGGRGRRQQKNVRQGGRIDDPQIGRFRGCGAGSLSLAYHAPAVVCGWKRAVSGFPARLSLTVMLRRDALALP